MRAPLHAASMVLTVALGGCGASDGILFSGDGGVWPARPALSFAGSPRLLIPNINDDTLAFVTEDGDPQLLGLEPVGDDPVGLEGPHDVGASPDGKYLYVVLSNYVPGSGTGPHGGHGLGTEPGSLLKLDARNLAKVGEAQVDRNASEIILSDDGATAWISHYDLARLQRQVNMGLPEADGLSNVAVVDTATMSRPTLFPVCPAGHDLELSADEKTLYVTCSQTDEIALFDTRTHAVTRVPVGAAPGKPLQPNYYPYTISRAPADDSLWIGCQLSGDLRVFDTKRGVMDPSRAVTLPGPPMFGAFLPDGKTLLMPYQGEDRVAIIDTSTSKIIGTVTPPPSVCSGVQHIEPSDDGKMAWLVCESDKVHPGTLVTIDLSNLASPAVMGHVAVGIYPNALEVLPPAP